MLYKQIDKQIEEKNKTRKDNVMGDFQVTVGTQSGRSLSLSYHNGSGQPAPTKKTHKSRTWRSEDDLISASFYKNPWWSF